jgi:hypothetical protein
MRVITTTAYLPNYLLFSRPLRIYGFIFFGGLLIAAVVGASLTRDPYFLLPAAVIVSRFVLPAISALALEPRHLLEAMPALFLFATAGFAFYPGLKRHQNPLGPLQSSIPEANP